MSAALPPEEVEAPDATNAPDQLLWIIADLRRERDEARANAEHWAHVAIGDCRRAEAAERAARAASPAAGVGNEQCPTCKGTGSRFPNAWKAEAYRDGYPCADCNGSVARAECDEALTTPFRACGIYYPDSDIFEIALEDVTIVHEHISGTDVTIMRAGNPDGPIVGLQVERASKLFAASPAVETR